MPSSTPKPNDYNALNVLLVVAHHLALAFTPPILYVSELLIPASLNCEHLGREKAKLL